MKLCSECSVKIPASISAFTRCNYCKNSSLCMHHRLPETHSCNLKESTKFQDDKKLFDENLRTNAVKTSKV